MKPGIKLIALTIILFSFSCKKENVDNQPNLNNVSTADIINPILGITTGTSTLTRSDTKISVSYKTTGLIPGHAYTLWWVIWNNPQDCAVPGACDEPDFNTPEAVGVDVLYATGLVVGTDGSVTFKAELTAGGNYQSANEYMDLPPAGGLNLGNSMSAEVHLALRSHGPVIPGMVDNQISSYLGGCSTFFDVFTEIPTENGECGEIEFAVHPPVSK
jgi:hypothetical protein